MFFVSNKFQQFSCLFIEFFYRVSHREIRFSPKYRAYQRYLTRVLHYSVCETKDTSIANFILPLRSISCGRDRSIARSRCSPLSRYRYLAAATTKRIRQCDVWVDISRATRIYRRQRMPLASTIASSSFLVASAFDFNWSHGTTHQINPISI